MAPPAKRVVEVENVPVAGESVLVRAIPPCKDRQLQRRALRADGTFDNARYLELRFRFGVVEPRFTPDQVALFFDNCGPTIYQVLDAVDAISRLPRVRIARRIPRRHHRALRAAATISQALQRRGAHQPRLRAGGTRRLACRRPRAVVRSSPRGGDSGDPDLDDQPPAAPPSATTHQGGWR